MTSAVTLKLTLQLIGCLTNPHCRLGCHMCSVGHQRSKQAELERKQSPGNMHCTHVDLLFIFCLCECFSLVKLSRDAMREPNQDQQRDL